jgi:hypothetical protein
MLDAGAGPSWRYVEPAGGAVWSRSEGLGVASFDMFAAGAFSSDPARTLRADAHGLMGIDAGRLGAGFQVGPDNPLPGLDGRAALLRSLGAVCAGRPELFGAEARPGGLFDRLAEAAGGGPLAAPAILELLLDALGPIWPGRLSLGGIALGDTWPHPKLAGPGPGANLVPFHKLSQWLSYSLIEPLEEAGIGVTALDGLTGLAEYRNGGLFLDCGVLALKDPSAAKRVHQAGSELVVEWRALTVALLDRIADPVRDRLGRAPEEFPLAKVLEGGTWAAGRAIARRLRADGGPPLRVASDGTIF